MNFLYWNFKSEYRRLCWVKKWISSSRKNSDKKWQSLLWNTEKRVWELYNRIKFAILSRKSKWNIIRRKRLGWTIMWISRGSLLRPWVIYLQYEYDFLFRFELIRFTLSPISCFSQYQVLIDWNIFKILLIYDSEGYPCQNKTESGVPSFAEFGQRNKNISISCNLQVTPLSTSFPVPCSVPCNINQINHCEVTPWSPWTLCNRQCSLSGTRKRFRKWICMIYHIFRWSHFIFSFFLIR